MPTQAESTSDMRVTVLVVLTMLIVAEITARLLGATDFPIYQSNDVAAALLDDIDELTTSDDTATLERVRERHFEPEGA